MSMANVISTAEAQALLNRLVQAVAGRSSVESGLAEVVRLLMEAELLLVQEDTFQLSVFIADDDANEVARNQATQTNKREPSNKQTNKQTNE
jgi:hypothetical protein